MATSNIPSDKRRPGTFLSFDDTSSARGLVPLTRRMVMVGAMTSAGEGTANEPEQAFDAADCDRIAGVNSFLALSAKRALRQFTKVGVAAELWLCPVADPAGTAATHTFTVTGTATEGGDLVIEVAGRVLSVPVASGDANTTVATAIKNKIDEYAADLPGTAGVASGVATLTCAVTGVNGNDVQTKTVSSPAGTSVAAAAAVAGVGAAVITTALSNLLSRDYWSVVLCNHAAADVVSAGAHLDSAWAAAKKRFRHVFIGESGTLGTATSLAAGSGGNRKNLVVTSQDGGKALPGEIAAAVGAMRLTRTSPNYNWDGQDLDLPAPDSSDVYIDTEIETSLAGGVTPLGLDNNGNVIIERLVTSQISASGAPFENLLDLGNSWTPAYYGLQIDAKVKPAIRGKNLSAELLERLEDIAYGVLKAGEELGDIHKVDEHKDEIVASSHPSVATRALLDIPVSPTPNAHQVDATIHLHVEGA